jgi:acyl transferase domain-containing protein
MVLSTRHAHTTARTSNNKKIAIVGMSCLFPGAPNVAAFWQNIVGGVDSTRDATEAEWNPERFYAEKSTSFEDIYCKRGGYITELADFDSLKYGVMPNSIPGSDPDQLLALRVASEALADAGYDGRRHELNNHEVILGRTSAPGAGSMNMIQRGQTIGQIMNVLTTLNPSFTQEQFSLIEEGLKSSLHQCNSDTIPAVMPNVLAGRIAGRLGFKGRSMILDSACASSLMAVDIAISDLLSGNCDLALAGGIHVNAFAVFYQMFCGLGALSRQQQIRPFDEKADGTILGEGLGMVVLKRLDDAVRDGDRIYASICGIGTSSDGQGTSMLAPSVDGEALALARAYEMAQVSPRAIALLEAHGTGTPSGDVVEMHAVEKVYGSVEEYSAWCAIGSVKSMIGHCQAASGIAGLIKAVLSLYYRVLPPTLNVDHPNSKIDWSRSPCYINTEARPWIHPEIHPQLQGQLRGESEPRRAAVSAFGFGGVNAHAILEEFEAGQKEKRPNLDLGWQTELCLFGGSSLPGLVESLQSVSRYAANNPDCLLRNVAFTLAKQAKDFANQNSLQIAIVAYSVSDLRSKIASTIAALKEGNTELRTEDVYFGARPIGPSAKLAFVLPGMEAAYPNMLSDLSINFSEVGSIFDYVDYLAASSGNKSMPSASIYPRPFKPKAEKVESLATMDSALPAVALSEWAFASIFQKLGIKPDALLGVNSGELAAIAIAGAVDIVGAAPTFHRIGMAVADNDVASERNSKALALIKDEVVQASLKPCTTQAWSASTAKQYPPDVAEMGGIVAEAVFKPMLLKQTIESMYENGFTIFVEIGPKGALTPLIADFLKDKPHLTVAANISSGSALTQLNRCLAELAANGVAMQLDYLFARRSRELLNFNEQAVQSKSRSIRLDLHYPEVSLPPATAQKVMALSPPTVSDSQISGEEVLSAQDSFPDEQPVADPVLQNYLSSMAQFQKNLVGMQQQVMVAYLTEQKDEQ